MKHDLTAFEQFIIASTILDPVQTPTVVQIKGHLTFTDQSVLFVRENYVTNDDWIDYSYHWQTAENRIIHRWDNAHVVFLPTSPHHQHVGSEDNVLPSEPMTLELVLRFISDQLTSG